MCFYLLALVPIIIISSLSDDILTQRPNNIGHSQFHSGEMNIIPFYLFIFF